MLREALQIVRELLGSGTCRFDGDHYTIDVPVLGPLSETRHRWWHRSAAVDDEAHHPLVDRVELAIGRATRGGVNELPIMATATLDEVKEMVGVVRDVSPGIAVSLLAFVAVGTGPDVDKMASALGDGLYGQLVGEAEAGGRAAAHRAGSGSGSSADHGVDPTQLRAPGSGPRRLRSNAAAVR